MRKYASAEERAAKNQKTTVRHFGFTEKVYGLPCTVRTMLLWKRHHRNAIVRISFFFFTGRHSSGSSPKAGCLCSLYITSIDARLRRASLLWRVVDGVSAKVL